MNYNETLLRIIENGSKQIREIDSKKMSLKPSDEKWSKKEILGHLVDSAVNNYQRVMLSQLKNDLIFEGYDQVNWVEFNDYQSRDVEEILKIWESLNIHISQLISTIPESAMNRKTVHHTFDEISMGVLGKGEESNLSYLIWDYIFHVEHHLAQIIDDYKNLNTNFKD
jgi:DinB family protein